MTFWNNLSWVKTLVYRRNQSQSGTKTMDNLEEPSNAAEPTICQRLGFSSLIGLACSFLATLFGATGSLIVKFLEDSSPYQIHFARVSIQFIVLLPLISYRKESIITNNWSTNVFLLIRGALGIPAYICLLYGIQFLPLGDAISISYCHVTLVGIFACICLKGETLNTFIIQGCQVDVFNAKDQNFNVFRCWPEKICLSCTS